MRLRQKNPAPPGRIETIRARSTISPRPPSSLSHPHVLYDQEPHRTPKVISTLLRTPHPVASHHHSVSHCRWQATMAQSTTCPHSTATRPSRRDPHPNYASAPMWQSEKSDRHSTGMSSTSCDGSWAILTTCPSGQISAFPTSRRRRAPCRRGAPPPKPRPKRRIAKDPPPSAGAEQRS